MTTTACDDQFAPGPIEPVRERFDIVSILRRNVASLEIALRRQTDRAEAAEEKLTTAREDMQSWIDSRNGWMERAEAAEAALKEAQEQEPVAYMIHEYQGTGEKRLQFQPHIPSIRDDVTGPIVTALYARPVPAAPAVAVPEEWREVLQMLFDACADYAVDVGEDAPLKFRVMMRRARALLQSAPQPTIGDE